MLEKKTGFTAVPPRRGTAYIFCFSYKKKTGSFLNFLTKGSRFGQGAVCLAPPPLQQPWGGESPKRRPGRGGGAQRNANHQLEAIRDAEPETKNTGTRRQGRAGLTIEQCGVRPDSAGTLFAGLTPQAPAVRPAQFRNKAYFFRAIEC